VIAEKEIAKLKNTCRGDEEETGDSDWLLILVMWLQP